MPCSNCNRTVLNSEKCRVIYCVCGKCNHCHVGEICPDGNHLYLEKVLNCKRYHIRKFYKPCNSNCSHVYIPGCNNCI